MTHDLLGIEPKQLASTQVYVSTCICGETFQRPSKELAASAHEFHWRGEMAAPFIAEIRQGLKGGE